MFFIPAKKNHPWPSGLHSTCFCLSFLYIPYKNIQLFFSSGKCYPALIRACFFFRVIGIKDFSTILASLLYQSLLFIPYLGPSWLPGWLLFFGLAYYSLSSWTLCAFPGLICKP
jgi:hypothetical protein